MIVHFANHAKRWLDQDPKNVVALHCQAGKGRAGLMSCVLLVRLGLQPDAEAAMTAIRKAPTSQSVPLGDEGYVDTATGRGTIRVGTDKIADLVPLPGTNVDTDTMVAFALAISPLYTR